jgi:hypothetical protein
MPTTLQRRRDDSLEAYDSELSSHGPGPRTQRVVDWPTRVGLKSFTPNYDPKEGVGAVQVGLTADTKTSVTHGYE